MTARVLTSMFAGTCRNCEKPYSHSTRIVRIGTGKFVHVECLTDEQLERLEKNT